MGYRDMPLHLALYMGAGADPGSNTHGKHPLSHLHGPGIPVFRTGDGPRYNGENEEQRLGLCLQITQGPPYSNQELESVQVSVPVSLGQVLCF